MRQAVNEKNASNTSAHLLVADDDPAVLRATSMWLRRNGYVVSAVSGREAVLHAIAAERFDLLVTDIHMPGNNELQMVRELRDIEPELPVILMTGYPSIASAIKALRLRAVDYLLKPIDPKALLEAVAAALQKSSNVKVIEDARQQLLAWSESLKELADSGPRPGVRRSHRASVLANLPAAERDALSKREGEVIEQLASGLRVNDVARALSISPHTVRSHLKSIFRKLQVESQLELLSKLHQRGS